MHCLRSAFVPAACLLAAAVCQAAPFSDGFTLFKPTADEQPLYFTDAAAIGEGLIGVRPSGSYSAQALYSTMSFDLSAAPVTASFRFLASSGQGEAAARVALGLDYELRGLRSGDSLLKAVWSYGGSGSTPGLTIGGSSGQTLAAPLEDGHWYSLSATWTLAAEGNAVLLEASLADHGISGEGRAAVLASGSVWITDPGLFDATGRLKPLHAGIYAQNSGTDGASLLKDVLQNPSSQIPEPALGLALLAGVALAAVAGRALCERRRAPLRNACR